MLLEGYIWVGYLAGNPDFISDLPFAPVSRS